MFENGRVLLFVKEREKRGPSLEAAPEKLLVGAGSVLEVGLRDTRHGRVETGQLL